MIDWKQIQTFVQAGDYMTIARKRGELEATMRSLGDMVARNQLGDDENHAVCKQLQEMAVNRDILMTAMQTAARKAFSEEVRE